MNFGVHVCSPKRNSPKGLSPHNIPGGQDPKPEWGPGPKVQWHQMSEPPQALNNF